MNKCICGQDARFTHVCLNGNTLPAQRPERTPFEELVRRATVATMPEQELREHVATLESRICSLQSERDTALARAKEWELAYDSSGFGPQTPAEVQVFLRERDRVNGQAAALRVSAAETALASARELLEDAWEERHAMKTSWCNRYRDWLTSHPAPVAAPCAGCAAARELLGQALMVLVHWNNYQAEEGRSYIPEDENAAVLLRIQAWLKERP